MNTAEGTAVSPSYDSNSSLSPLVITGLPKNHSLPNTNIEKLTLSPLKKINLIAHSILRLAQSILSNFQNFTSNLILFLKNQHAYSHSPIHYDPSVNTLEGLHTDLMNRITSKLEHFSVKEKDLKDFLLNNSSIPTDLSTKIDELIDRNNPNILDSINRRIKGIEAQMTKNKTELRKTHTPLPITTATENADAQIQNDTKGPKKIDDPLKTTPKSNQSLQSEQRILYQYKKKLIAIKDTLNTIFTYQNKLFLFNYAKEIYNNRKISSSLETVRLKNDKEFQLTETQSPAYFQELFRNSNSVVTTSPEFYDYQPTAGYIDFLIDFANSHLGGGVRKKGNVQEEVMFTETPELLNLANQNLNEDDVCTILTREGHPWLPSEEALQGSPQPLLIKNVHRTIATACEIYARAIGQIHPLAIHNYCRELTTPQKYHCVAIASPRIHSSSLEDDPLLPFSVKTLRDALNTWAAGCKICQENVPPGEKFMIHTGPIGCGAFNQNKFAIYFIQRLVAAHFNIPIKLWGYQDSEAQACEKGWNELVLQFEGKSIERCIELISSYCVKNYSLVK